MSQYDEELRLKIQGDAANARAALLELSNSIKGLEGETQQSTGKMEGYFKTALGTLSGFLGAQAIMSTVRSAFDFAIGGAIGMNQTLETTTLRFSTLMGNSQLATQHVKDLFEIAKKTPFETGPIIEASLKLQTFGGAALNTKANIILLGDAAAATGAPINDLGFWVGRLYSAIQGGQPFGEAAMRLQELAVLTPQARQEMERLQKSGASADAVFKTFQDSLQGFNGAMEKQAGTWEGVVSTFTDTVNILIADTFKPYFEVIRDLGGELNKVLDGMTDKIKDVTASANDQKQAFITLVEYGLSGAITGFAFLVQEGIALHKLWMILVQTIKGVEISLLSLGYAAAKVMDTVTLGQAGWQKYIDQLGDGIEKLATEMKNRDDQMIAETKLQGEWSGWAERAHQETNKFVQSLRDSAAGLNDFVGPLQTASKATEKHTQLTKEQEKAQKKLREEMKKLVSKDEGLDSRGLMEASTAMDSLKSTTNKLTQEGYAAHLPFRTFNFEILQPMPNLAQAARIKMGELAGSVIHLGDVFSEVATTMPQTMFKAFTGGGGAKGGFMAMGSQFGSMLGEQIQDQLTNQLSNFGAKSIGKFASGLLNMLPGVGSLLGPGIGWLANKIMNIGGPSKKELEGREAEKQFEKQFGSFDNMLGAVAKAYEATGRGADQARRDVEELMRAEKQGADAVKASMDKINAAFDEQKQDQLDLQDALQEYNFTVAEMGPTLQKQKLDEQAGKLINQWRLLVGAGVEVGTVNAKMAENMQAYINTAMKTGQEVPEAMKPIIDKMVEQGVLTDANGKKITDTAQLNIKWGSDLNTTMQKFVDKLETVLKKIGMIPAAAADAVKKIPRNPFEDWAPPDNIGGVNIDWPGAGTVPVMDRPLERVTSSGLAWLNPGDVVGMPHLTRGAGAGITIHVAGSVIAERDLERTILDAVSRAQRDRYLQRAG